MMAFASIVIVGVLTLQSAQGLLTIPPHELGFVYKAKEVSISKPSITLSFYIDNTCDNSQHAFPTIIKVADHYGPQKLKLVSHLFSLPYHRNSHTIAKGAHVIDAYTNGTATYAWFKVIYDNLNKLTTSATTSLSDKQVMDILAPIAHAVSGIPQNQFRSQVQLRDVDHKARLGFDYCCTRGVYGTPTFMVDDVLVAADYSWTFNQWMELLKPLIK